MMKLTIDGSALDEASAIVHFQSDPYPGGHEYVLEVDHPRAVEALQRAGLWSNETLGIGESDRCLRIISIYLKASGDDAPIRFVLNSASCIDIEGSRAVIRGICSEV